MEGIVSIVDTLENEEEYKISIQEAEAIIAKYRVKSSVDEEKPDITIHEQLRMMLHEFTKMIGLSLELHRLNLNPEGITDNGILSGIPGEKMSVQQTDQVIQDKLASFYRLSRELQLKNTKLIQRTTDAFVTKKEPICEIPAKIKEGTNDQISDSGLKLLTIFKGEGENAAEHLRSFLREVYNVAVTNKLNEATTVEVLLRKLQGTARQLADNFIATEEKVPALREIVLMLEENYMSGCSPEVASAKLNIYTKRPTESYSHMQGEIAELTSFAARGIDPQSRKQWIKQKKVSTFLQAISAEDRDLIYKENQARKMTSVPEMNMEQMARHLITYHAQTEAFVTASHLQNMGTTESIQKITGDMQNVKVENNAGNDDYEEEDEDYEDEEYDKDDKDKKIEILKELLFEMENRNFSRGQQPNGNGGRQSQTFGNNGGGTRPRVFVTCNMVNVPEHTCLKCGSPDHKFKETDKCCYGTANLMQEPCHNCGIGGHHKNVCVKPVVRNVGAPAAKAPTSPQEQENPGWIDQAKGVEEHHGAGGSQPFLWGPTLFNT